MNKEVFVQNIKHYCSLKGIKPTVACKESGAGKDLINQIETKGSIPSIEKVQLLAAYLGCTTSELLGEGEPTKTAAAPAGSGQSDMDGVIVIRDLPPDVQKEVLAFVEFKRAQTQGFAIAARGGKTIPLPKDAPAVEMPPDPEADKKNSRY